MSTAVWPKISIVTPSFNHGQYLESTINSVLSQGYPNLEYIIIDGRSTDNSLDIIKKYSHHLHYWSSKQDQGHYFAVNEGFSKATGEIFAWINSDDIYCMDALKTVGTIFSFFPDVSWLTTMQQMVFDKQGRHRSVKVIPGFSRQAFLDGMYFTNKFYGVGFIQQESTFWRRVLWNKTGGIRTKFGLAGDFDLWARFFLYEDLYGVDHPLAGFRNHGENRSRQREAYIREAEESLEEMRVKVNWHPNTDLSTFRNKVKYSPISRRLFGFSNTLGENLYSSSIITQVDTNHPNQWQITNVHF